MEENFPNLVKEIEIEVKEAQMVPNKMNLKETHTRHIIIKTPKVKDKERILQVAKEKQLATYGEAPIRLSADFSKETLQASRQRQEIFKVMKSKDLQPILCSKARIKGRIKSFLDKKKQKEYIITLPTLYEI